MSGDKMTKDIDDMTPEEIRAETARLKAETTARVTAMKARMDRIDDNLDQAEKAILEDRKSVV